MAALPGLRFEDPQGWDELGLGRGSAGTGSHHGLHMQDPQGLRDLRAGVHLAVHAHQEGPVQQHSRVLCGGDGAPRVTLATNTLAAVTRPRDSQEPALGRRASGRPGPVLTLAQESVLGQVPEGRLHHLKVLAAQAVHECGQEVSCDAERATHFSGHLRPVPTPDPHPTGRAEPPGSLVWPPGGQAVTWFSRARRRRRTEAGGVSPGAVPDGAQGQAEGQVAARLLGRAHQPLQVGLTGGKVGGV